MNFCCFTGTFNSATILFGQSSSHTQTAKATYHVTFHLAIETSVEDELTQMGSTNLGSPEARKCQSRCIQIPIPCSNASDLHIPRSSPTTNCFQYSLKPRCLRFLKGMQMRKRSIQSMRGLRGEIMQKLGNTKQILKMSKSKGWLFGCSMVESRSQYY